jgi:hypothetical protein
MPYGRRNSYFVHPTFCPSLTTTGAMKNFIRPLQQISPKSIFSRLKKSGLVILPCCLQGLNKMHPQPVIELKRV